MSDFLKRIRQTIGLMVLPAVALSPNCAVIAADKLDESQAIRESNGSVAISSGTASCPVAL